MSWDIVLFNSRQKIETIDELDETYLEPLDFCAVFKEHFEEIKSEDTHREIKGSNFVLEYFTDGEPTSNQMLNVYGENGLHELVLLAKNHNWQIFDTALGEMIDLENPARNGYNNFQHYLLQVTGKK